MEKITLNGQWNAVCYLPDGTNFPLEGQVPGCSIQDLVSAGKLPKDLFWRDRYARWLR